MFHIKQNDIPSIAFTGFTQEQSSNKCFDRHTFSYLVEYFLFTFCPLCNFHNFFFHLYFLCVPDANTVFRKMCGKSKCLENIIINNWWITWCIRDSTLGNMKLLPTLRHLEARKESKYSPALWTLCTEH